MSTSRTAEYAIKGFVYQFLLTLSKLLDTSHSEVYVEGIIEDLDVVTATGIEAFQCKYHETKNKFSLSAIYKPVLQMLVHFKNNPNASIKYRLHAHFPSELVGSKKTLSSNELNEVLATTSVSLQSYVLELASFAKSEEFIKRFEIHFGPSYDALESSIIVSLANEGLTTEDVKEIFYPNAVHKIAATSIEPDVRLRKLQKDTFLTELKAKKKAAISRWTKELQSYSAILKKRREQLRDNLNKNFRSRCLIIDEVFVDDFDRIVPFIQDFVEKYNGKVRNACPTFSLKCSESKINQVWRALRGKHVEVERGKIAEEFDENHFLRSPMTSLKDNKVEFKVRICNHDEDFEKIIAKGKFDDIIVISDTVLDAFESLSNINVEILETRSINELRYLTSLNNNL